MMRKVFATSFAIIPLVSATTCPAAPTPTPNPEGCTAKLTTSCAGFSCQTGWHIRSNPESIATVSNVGCCLQDVTGKCSGNTNTAGVYTHFTCGAGHKLKVLSATTAGTTAAACCDDITGMCTGNKDGTGDVTCTGTTVNRGVAVSGTTTAACCREPCSRHTCDAAQGWTADTAKSAVLAATNAACCASITCCGNADSSLDRTSRCPATKVFIGGTAMRTRSVSNTPDDRCCTLKVTGKCSGNSLSSDNFVCPSGKSNKGAITGTTEAVCCQDNCVGFSCPAATHILIQNPENRVTPDQASCCTTIVTGKCSGNTNSAQDFACPAGKSNNGFITGAAEAACCTNIVNRCTGNLDSTQNVNCASHCHNSLGDCRPDPDKASNSYTAANKCARCCYSAVPAGSSAATTNAALSALVLAGVLSVLGF